MNKRILPVFVFCALCYSAQAQDAKGGISDAMMQQIKQSYQNTSADKAIRNAIGSNDIRKLALNQDNMKGMDTHFSVKVNSKVSRTRNHRTLLALYGAERDACQSD